MDPLGGGPCVLYLHGNASSQLEGQFLVPNLCKYGIYVYCLDFAGCGCSGGQYVSLGYYEKDDTEFIIDQLHTQLNLGPFIIWGRSMGAATSLLVDHPLVIGRISDSAFTSIPDMCSAIAISYHLPPIFIPLSLFILKQKVIHQAKFNIEDVSPISVKYKKIVPVIFGHAKNDQFIPFDQCERLFKHYPSDSKKLQILNGGHNSRRERSWIQLCVTFIFNKFGLKIENPKFSTTRNLQESVFHFSSFNEMLVEQDNNDNTIKRHRRKKRNSFDSYNSHYEYSSKNRHWQHHKHYKFSKKDFMSKNSRYQKSKFDYKMMRLNSQNENRQNGAEIQKTTDKNEQNLNNNHDMQKMNNKIDQKSNQQKDIKMQHTNQKENSHNDHKIQKDNQQNESKNKKLNQKDDKKLEKRSNDEKEDHQNAHNNNPTESCKNQVESQSKDDQHIKCRNSHQKHAQNKSKTHKHNEHHHAELNEDGEKEIQQKKKNQTEKREIENIEMIKVEKKDNKSNDHIENGHHHKHNQHPHFSIENKEENKNECDKKDHHGKLKANENNNK